MNYLLYGLAFTQSLLGIWLFYDVCLPLQQRLRLLRRLTPALCRDTAFLRSLEQLRCTRKKTRAYRKQIAYLRGMIVRHLAQLHGRALGLFGDALFRNERVARDRFVESIVARAETYARRTYAGGTEQVGPLRTRP